MPSAAVPKGSADDEDSRTEWDHDLDGRAADELDEFFWHFDMLCDGDRNAFFDGVYTQKTSTSTSGLCIVKGQG